MSRRNKPRAPGQSSRLIWPVFLVGAILIAAAAALLLRKPADTGTPQIMVDQKTIDYGYVKFGETRQFEIKVTNAGDGALRFREQPYIEVLEGC